MPIVNRVRDVLGVLGGNSPTYPTQGMINQVPRPDEEIFINDTPDYNINRRMSELYKPEHQDSDAFNALLSAYPERGNPGLLRKIGSSLTALGPGGYEAGHRALNQPFYNELEDWKNKIIPTQNAASGERADNANMRSVANSIIAGEQRDRTLERQSERDRVLGRQGDERIAQGEERVKQGDVRLSQSEQRVKQAEERLKVAQAVAKGGVFQMDKLSGTGRMVYKDGTSVPVDVNQLGQEELLELQQGNSLERIEKTGEQSRSTRATPTGASSRDRLRTEVIDDPEHPGSKILVTINLDTNEVKPAEFKIAKPNKTTVTPVTRTPETEANKRTGALNKAKQVKAANPQWAKYIVIRGNDFEIKRPSSVFGVATGPTKEDYDKIYNAIYKSNRATDNVNPEERVNVINPQGAHVSIKKSQLEEALKSGYKNAQ